MGTRLPAVNRDTQHSRYCRDFAGAVSGDGWQLVFSLHTESRSRVFESHTMLIMNRSHSRNFTARAFFSAVLFVCALGLAGATSAGAATYSVYSCLGPNDAPLPNSSWLTSVNTPSQTLSFSFGSNCGDLSVIADPADSFSQNDGAAYVFDAPTGITISGYAVNRAASITYPSTTGGRTQLSAGIQESTGSATTEFDCVAVTSACEVTPSVASTGGLAIDRLSIGVRCAAETGNCPAGSFTKLSSRLIDARVDVEDPNAPVINTVGGALPGSSAVAGFRTLDVTGSDVGGGVRMINLAIDGNFTQASGAGGSCGQPYTLRAPCPSGLERTLSVNTAALTDGMHTATLTAIDAAGNTSAPYSFTFVVTAGGQNGGGGGGGTPPSNGSPAVEQPIVKSEKSVISSRTGKGVLVEGTLTTADGVPVAGALLDVTALDLGVFNAAPKSIGTTTTTAAGRFSFRVKPDGARRISVLFKPFPASLGTAVTSTIVREDLTLSVKRSKSRIKPGGLLTLSGKLDGAGSAADDTPVEIDALIDKTWRAVGVVEANSRGSYKWRYRFTRVRQPTRFTFRTIVRRNTTWPWPTETSKRVKVLVAR